MPVTAPSDRRLRRPRVSPVRRRPWYRSGMRIAAFIGVVLLIGAGGCAIGAAAASARVLAVEEVFVSGNERLSRGEVLGLLDGLVGTNILTVDLEAWQRRLLASPWVAGSEMRRVLPRSIAVEIREHHPMAIARVRGSLYLIDASGARIDEYAPPYADLDLPVVDGLAAGRSGALLFSESRAALVSRLLGELQTRPDLAARVSQIDVADTGNVVIVLNDEPVLLWMGTSRFVERLEKYLETAGALRENVADIEYVDLRYDDRIVVGPARPPANDGDRAGRGRG